MRDRRIAVVGGGLAGLTAGYALARRGASVVVFEARKRLGGRAITAELEGTQIDPGAQLFGSMYARFLGLARSLGLSDQLVEVAGRDALWRNGRAHEVVYGSVSSMVASGGLSLRTKIRLGTKYVPFLSRHARALDVHAPERAATAGLDDETIAAWGNREIDPAFVRFLVYPQLAAYYGASPAETSAGFYHILARYGLDVTLYAMAGGVGQVSDRLASAIRNSAGAVRLQAPVRELHLAADSVTVVSDAGAETFDGAVGAVPAGVLGTILSRGAPTTLVDWLGAVRYRPALTLVLLLDRRTDVRFFGLSFPQGATRFVAAVTVQENKGIPLIGASPGALVAFPTPETARELIELDSREILERMVPEIAVAFPGVEPRITRARVYRWPVGGPIFVSGYLKRLGMLRADHLEGAAPLAIAGDYLYGPSVEGAVTSGFAAAARLERRVSRRDAKAQRQTMDPPAD